MDRTQTPRGVRVEKVKRPGGVFWYDAHVVRRDAHGCWLHAPVGSRWGAPHDEGALGLGVLLLVSPDRPWVAWWVDDPDDRRLEIDVCLPPEETATGWRYVDLELDPVWHESEGRVEIEDEEELEAALAGGWVTPVEAALARRTAAALAEALSSPDPSWPGLGWRLIAELG